MKHTLSQLSTTVMSLLQSELILRHEGVVRRSATQEEAAAAAAAAAAGEAGAAAGTTEFLGEANLLELLSDLVLHLPACATSIHRWVDTRLLLSLLLLFVLQFVLERNVNFYPTTQSVHVHVHLSNKLELLVSHRTGQVRAGERSSCCTVTTFRPERNQSTCERLSPRIFP